MEILELKNVITKIKKKNETSVYELNSRMGKTKERASEFEDRSVEIIQ